MNDLLVVCVVVCALLAAEHYFPWHRLLRRRLPRVGAYVLGCAAVLGPQVGLVIIRPLMLNDLVLPWVAGGVTVVMCYMLDGSLDSRDHLQMASEFEEVARDGADVERS